MSSLRTCLELAGEFGESRLAQSITQRADDYVAKGWRPPEAESQAVSDALDHLRTQLQDIKVQAAEFDEKKHPRNPKGAVHGGQFTKKPEPIKDDAVLLSTMTKIGGSLGGSSPAEQWQDKATTWYVKETQSKDHATNELLAARLYHPSRRSPPRRT